MESRTAQQHSWHNKQTWYRTSITSLQPYTRQVQARLLERTSIVTSCLHYNQNKLSCPKNLKDWKKKNIQIDIHNKNSERGSYCWCFKKKGNRESATTIIQTLPPSSQTVTLQYTVCVWCRPPTSTVCSCLFTQYVAVLVLWLGSPVCPFRRWKRTQKWRPPKRHNATQQHDLHISSYQLHYNHNREIHWALCSFFFFIVNPLNFFLAQINYKYIQFNPPPLFPPKQWTYTKKSTNTKHKWHQVFSCHIRT